MESIAEVAKSEYVLVTTFRKDGTPVGTPVWAARDGDALVLWTVTDSWKVKRIRRNPRVTVAPCDFRGKPEGQAVDGTAEILDGPGTERVRTLIARKYGIKGRIGLLASKIRRGSSGTIGIRIV